MRQLTAIMFTDLVGFTALMQRDEAAARAAVLRHRALLQEQVTAHGGETIQFYGDGALTLFPSAVEAIHAAVAVQIAAGAEPVLPLRIGIHTGDVVRGEDGVYGDGVNVAARVQGLGVPGSVLLSGKVNDEIKNHPELRTRPLGSFELKNVKEPIDVVAVLADGLVVPLPKDLPVPAASRDQSVAVLPFVSMSSDPEHEYFSDGITEEIINILTRIPGLKVTARTSSFAFKGRNEDIRSIGQQLGVATVLEGSVRHAGGRVRVTAQLIETRSGYHLFSEVFDRPMEDVFQVQDDVARAIATQLQVLLDGSVRTERHTHFPDASCDCESYTEYLRGLQHLNRWTPESALKALAAFERALAIDGDWPQPLTGTAAALIYLGRIGHRPASAVYPAAETAARRALELDPTDGEAHAMLALLQLHYHWNFAAAYASFQQALELKPGSAMVHERYAFYLRAAGALTESVAELEGALALDPLSLATLTHLGAGYAMIGQYAQAHTTLQAALDLDHNFRPAWEALGIVHLGCGKYDEAIACFEQLSRITGVAHTGAGLRGAAYALAGRRDDALEMLDLLKVREAAEPAAMLHLDFAAIHASLGEIDAALDRLERAAEARSAEIVYLDVMPVWKPLRQHPRFSALRQRAPLVAA